MVAKHHPFRVSEFSDSIVRVKGIARHAPPPVGVYAAGEGVNHRIDVGANEVAREPYVIGGVDDDGEFFADFYQSREQFWRPRSTRKYEQSLYPESCYIPRRI